jgi:hypothetical protein
LLTGYQQVQRVIETSKKINSDSINNILEKSSRAGPESKTNKDSKISTQHSRITRDTKTKELLNKIEIKEFGFVYDKIRELF